ncbi:uncharacterized protein LOC130998632 [Salvia miltiorrhiza]|uniref:uncharacterized protein LOC130998632 n=1 Tax=Salvia miltiorrhiza TaxID=226208 RepID=UPI0025AB842C|nr:uncharacterized protein LOC130998632 [Salvia miltiorrhiza]
MNRNKEEEDDEKWLKIWDCGSPLYDAYELVAVSHVVERNCMILPYLSGSRNDDVADSCSSEKAVETTSERPSVMGFFCRNVWKRKRDGERDHKVKRHKISGISKIFAWRK